MISLKSAKRTEPQLATIERAESVNERYGLSVPEGMLALVTVDVPGLTAEATVNPFAGRGMLAIAQMLIIATREVALHTILDLQDRSAGEYCVQAVRHGFSLVLVDETSGRARYLRFASPVKADEAIDRIARARLAENLKLPSHPEVYLRTVSSVGFKGCGAMLEERGYAISANRTHFRPVLSSSHLAHMTETLSELVARDHKPPSVKDLLDAALVGCFTHAEMLALVQHCAARQVSPRGVQVPHLGQ